MRRFISILFLVVSCLPVSAIDPLTITPDGHILVNANGITVDLVEFLVPVGTIHPYAGATVPTGWALCDGSSVPRDGTYARLFAVIGAAFGSTDGASFNLPDLRGRFLRGVDGSAGIDPNKDSRIALKTGGNAGNNVGSAQADAMQGHAHFPRFYYSGSGGYSTSITNYTYNGPVTQTISTTDPVASNYGTPRLSTETRPTNVYVNFIIKL